MLNDLYLHDTTRRLILSYVKKPHTNLLLSGKIGTGLDTLARAIAQEMVAQTSDILHVEPDDKGTIPIERVRALYIDTRDVRTSKQVVVIDDADAMSNDAQNAFLKLLEEPNDRVYFILTTHRPEALLQTISSRTQHVEVLPITAIESQALLRAHHVTDSVKIQQALFIANGRPAELARLADSPEYFESHAQSVRLARDFLSGTTYERLVIASQLTNRQDALNFVDVLANLIQIMGKREKSLLKEQVTHSIETAANRLESNGHVRTQLINLALHV